MRSLRTAAAIGVVATTLGAAAPASADAWLGSSVIYGGDTQRGVACALNNVGNVPVALSNLRIFSTSGAAIATQVNNCGAVLAAKSTCTFTATAVSQTVYGCKVLVDRKAIMRGVIQIFDVSGENLNTEPMQ